jgi:hypothetical protein
MLSGCIFALALFLCWPPPEPKYQGRNLSYWLHQYNQVHDFRKLTPIDSAVRAMGTNALPIILSHLEHKESALRLKVSRLVAKQHFIKRSLDGENELYVPSLLALNALGPAAEPICPELQRLCEQPGSAEIGEQALLLIGASAIPTVEQACRNTNTVVAAHAALILAQLKSLQAGTNAKCWLLWLSGSDDDKPRAIVMWLSGEDHELESITWLGANLHHPDQAVRQASKAVLQAKSGLITNLPTSLLSTPYTSTDPVVIRAATKVLRQ